MPRDPDSLKIKKWAAQGIVTDPETVGIDRSHGWGATYLAPGGKPPEGEVFNQLFRELTGFAVEQIRHGLLEWDSSISYVHPAVVMGSDGKVYASVQDSTGIDPVADADADGSHWTLFLSQLEEQLQDIIGAMFSANDSQNYNDATGKIDAVANRSREILTGTGEAPATSTAHAIYLRTES